MENKMHTVVLQLLQKKNNTFLYCQRFYGSLINGLQFSVNKRMYLRNDQVLMTLHDILHFSNKNNIHNYSFSPSCLNTFQLKGSIKKSKTFSILSNYKTFSTPSLNIYRKLNDDSQKKADLINKIYNALGHNNSRLTPEYMPLSNCSQRVVSSEEDGSEATTIEKKILHLLNSWEIESAIKHLQDSISNGANPDRTVVFRLLRQIAELGKVESLMELYEYFLKEKELVSRERFYQCIGLAVFTSGHVPEAMEILKQKCEADMSSSEIDNMFTVLATLIFKEFEHHFHLVEEFVDSVLSKDLPVIPARAVMWKCFVLAEKFDKADELMSKHEELRKLIPVQATAIVQTSAHIDFDREAVFHWLIQQPYLKKGLRAAALHMLVQLKCDTNEWSQVFKYLSLALENDVNPHQATLINFLSVFFDECSDEGQLVFWKSICERLKVNETDINIDEENNGNVK